ncbi:hypothetical protein V6N13_051002 [Hibiscus sabdariffa]
MLFKRASKYGPWLRAEIKGRKKYGKLLPKEQLQAEASHNNGEEAKVNEQVKIDDPKSEFSHGISPAIIPISLEDQSQTSTMGNPDAFKASDNHILAGKNKLDDPSSLVNAQEKEWTFHSDKCIIEKIGCIDGEDCNPLIAGKPSPLGFLICNNFEKISVTNKRKRDEQEALSIETEDKNDKVDPICIGDGEEDEDPVEVDDPAGTHPDEK